MKLGKKAGLSLTREKDMIFLYAALLKLESPYLLFQEEWYLAIALINTYVKVLKIARKRILNNELLHGILICDALHDLVLFAQFKKREKHP